MKSLLRPLWRPTLLRRVLGALLLAFALAGTALLVLDFVQFKREMAERPGVQKLADAMAASLADMAEARDAALIVQTRARETNRMRRSSGQLPGDVEFSLTNARGQTVFATHGAGDATTTSHWLAEARGGPWRLTLAEPRLGDATVLGWLGGDLLASLLLAFPLVLLPLWLAVRSGMKPLRDLADRVAQRDAQDLSPLGIKPRHDELKPLVAAFDGLLERLRGQLQRERAFVQDAAHELRTPMAVVATQAHLLSHARSDAERREAATALDAALQRSAHLSRQLLLLATLDEGRVPTAEPLDLAAVVEQALAPLASHALERQLDLSLDAPASLRVRMDRTAFESVLVNLVDNALRYVPPGGHVAVTLETAGPTVWLRVADDGPGIPPAEREAAFERFWRGTASGDVPGTGLGLAIVRRAANRLGGSVRLEGGAHGRGCCFIVVLPTGI
ncbi:HAMP domain-containing sensor histidine kinase [Roseateles cellulosilyticus]|uniref:histidine kinase n=1 Tax=Pelomonas cellulosilytica TaxID=2906762 RepID=A0ABS8XK27_9BURK|nr:HAMP domain-containing sensor histidine kinase [Pelomonas sp. P8]MCE4553189.1 HAMP domain-containing histidine kinase [Pelomonas sp. P8]